MEDTSTVLLVLEQESNAKTCASLVLQMKMKSAHWSATVNTDSPGISPQPYACLLDGSEVLVELLHTRMQSINLPQARNGPVSIAGSSTDHGSDNTQSFEAQSMWSYLHAMPVEAKLK